MLPLRWPETPVRAVGGTHDPAEAGGTDRAGSARSDSSLGATPIESSPTEVVAKPQVVVRTSSRRRKTATAFWEDGKIVVVVPSHVRKADRGELVDWLVARVLAKRPRAAASDEALARRAADLADRYVDGVRPRSIRWVANQHKRWGSCSIQTGDIRLSDRLRAVPEWVLDATIVHELAHLLHADHSPGFYAIAKRHPRQQDATIFLEGYSLGLRTSPV